MDQFIGQIATEIDTYSLANGYGYNVKQQNSPNRKQWDETPLVIVCPSNKQNINYPSFCGAGVVSSYDCFLVNNGNLASDFTNAADNFLRMAIALFMPQSDAMLALGSYQTRVMGKYDYDRSIYPKGYLVSCFEVTVSWIVN